MALHEYKVLSSTRGGAMETTVLLSDADAEAQGLTAKDRVSKADQTVQGGQTYTGEDAQKAADEAHKAVSAPANKASSPESNK